MSDTQLLRDILAELRKITKKLDDLNAGVAGVETAVYDSAPSS